MPETLTTDMTEFSNAATQPAFWRRHFPKLALPGDNRPASGPSHALKAGKADESLIVERLMEDGYFQDRNATFKTLAPLLATAVRTCLRLNIPPTFIFLFDETWACFRSLDPVLSRILGPDYRMLPDFWTWHVDPQAGEAGWRPHRDKGYRSLGPDRKPLSLTVWAPLSDATPLSSCMYVLPAGRDPVYGTPNDNAYQIDLPNIRALPGEPGDYFCWNQAVLHWGSASSRFSPEPRMSMALEFQRGDMAPFNQPLIPPNLTLDFDTRLKLVAKQILQYRHMYPLDPEIEALARRLLGA